MRMRELVPVVASAAVLFIPISQAHAAPASMTLAADTILTPGFSTSIPNYTTSCATGTVNMTASAGTGMTLAVDGHTAKSGSQTVAVPLHAGQRFKVKAKKGGKTTTHSIRCLPADFPVFTVEGSLPATIPLFGFSNIRPVVFNIPGITQYAIIADRNGVPVWWMEAPQNLFNVMGMKGGRIAMGLADGPLTIYRPSGTLDKRMRPTIGQPDAHEAIPTSRGTFYLGATSQRFHIDLTPISGPADGATLDSNIEEVSATGKSLWTWRSKDYFAISDTLLPQRFIPLTNVDPSGGSVWDIVHLNSIEDDNKGGIIASFRNTSAVYRIVKSTKAIDWKFGGTPSDKSLRVIGDDGTVPHLSGQHDARLLPDGTITIQDNGSNQTRPARVTRWRIDRVAKTATLVEELKDPTIGRSVCCGSARKQTDGSWLVAWGSLSVIRGYNAAHRMTFNLHFADHGLTYRATPVTTKQVTTAQLLTGMDYMHKR